MMSGVQAFTLAEPVGVGTVHAQHDRRGNHRRVCHGSPERLLPVEDHDQQRQPHIETTQFILVVALTAVCDSHRQRVVQNCTLKSTSSRQVVLRFRLSEQFTFREVDS